MYRDGKLVPEFVLLANLHTALEFGDITQEEFKQQLSEYQLMKKLID